MKKIIALTLTITILLSMAFSVYADDTVLDSGSCGANLTYTIDSNGNLIIDGSGATDTYAVSGPLAPWYSHNDIIKTIQIGSNVTSIDAFAFSGLTSLETIYWDATDCTINRGLYESPLLSFNVGANELSVIFGNGVENIPNDAFNDCTKLKNVTMSNTINNITYGAFSGCTALTSISLPESVTTIGNSAFAGCTNLTYITIPNSVTNMGVSVFEDCSNLTHVTLGNGLTTIGNKVFKNCTSLIGVIVPENVDTIGTETFRNCQSLKSVIIPANVDSIGNMAFYNCNSLEKVYFGGTRNELRALYTFDGSVELICNYVPATQIELNKTAIELHPGNTTQLTATITPSNATYDYVVWSSNNTEVATVTADGLVEVLKEGNVTITATSVDGFLSKTCEIEVTPKLTPTCNAPINVTATYGQSLSDVVLDNPGGNTDGLWSWASPEELVGDVGSRTFKATFNPTDTDNYIVVENIDVTVTVEPKNISVQIGDIDDENYLNEQIKPSVVVNGDGRTLVLNTDYSVEYGENIYVGIGSVTVKSKTEGSNYTFADTTKDFNIVAIEQSPIITETASLTRDRHTLDLNTLVTNAKGDVSFTISGEANGCTIDNGVLTSGVNQGTIKITVSITAKDVNGDTINEYNAYTVTDAITITINDKATQAALNITSGTTVTRGRTLTLTTEGGNGDGAVTYIVANGTGEATIAGNVLTAVKAGTVTVVATKAEDATYNSISSAPVTITIENQSYGGGGGGGAPTSYTIKFESNGGSEVKAITVNKNATATEPTAPIKDGFKFDGWYADKELTTVYDFATKVTKNFTLYAKWAEIEKEPELDETEVTFTDVKRTDWFYEYIKYVINNKLMNGVSNNNFAPNDTLTRAMLVTVLYRHAGEPATNRSIPFSDVDMGAYYANAVSWAKQNGIISGINENEFAPNDNITREQIATIIYRYAKYKGFDVSDGENTNILSYNDVNNISEYAISSMQYACGSGLMVGKTNSTLNPKDNATRAEIAAILHRFIEVNK